MKDFSMKYLSGVSCLIVVLLVFACRVRIEESSSKAEESVFCKTKENITASGLIGSWEIDEKSAENNGSFVKKDFTAKYTEDDSVVDLFLAPLKEMKKCVYLAGKLEYNLLDPEDNFKAVSVSSPFVLIDLNGNPTILYDERGQDKNAKVIDDLHLSYQMLAKGKTPQQDILFIGGDNNNQAMVPFKRLK